MDPRLLFDTITLAAATGFEYVPSLLRAGHSFNQISIVIDNNRNFSARRKAEVLEPGRGFLHLANHVCYRNAAVVRFDALFVGVLDRR
jgi:hypothetical protein